MTRKRDPLSDRARRIESDLAELARLVHRRSFGAEASFPERLALTIDVAIPAERSTDVSASPPLLARLAEAVRAAGSKTAAVAPGRVFCFRCESAACEHAAPPRPRSVFAGFSPTGQPEWSDFAQALLDARHEDVEALFDATPAVLGLVQPGRDLKARLLHPFGKSSKTYDLLVQLVAGHFGGTGGDASAITIQAVESRRPDGRTRLTLNPIGDEAAAFLREHPSHPFAVALADARTRLGQIEDALGAALPPGRRSEIMRKIPGILHDLRRAIERRGRQSGRRTRHAAERAREERPTQAAIQDAWKAADADLLADEERGTFIVLGPRGRAHAFTPEGKHVTSLILDRDALSRRLARKRWRPATSAEIQTLRTALPART